ncbi:MAG: hypothetical protein LBQ32_01755, partial [Burkholderiaceae bacterium]|nr:hypothetical protein [Burkholderiaceae bacterium]
MGKDDPQITAAACRYILIGLLQRLEQKSPGLVVELQSGIAGDHQAKRVSGKLSLGVAHAAIPERTPMIERFQGPEGEKDLRMLIEQ